MKIKLVLFVFICLVLSTHLVFAEPGEFEAQSATTFSDPSAQSVGAANGVTTSELWEAQMSSAEESNTSGIAEALSSGNCCTPPSCPSGYTDQGVSCIFGSLSYACTRTCYR